MQFSEIVSDFFAHGFDQWNDNSTGLAMVKRWVNTAYSSVCAEEDWPFLETSTDQVAPYTFTDLDKILAVVAKDTTVSLEPVDRRTLERKDVDLAETGTGSYWYMEGDTLKTWPVDTATLSIRYKKLPVDMSADTDVPIIPVRFHDLIVKKACWFAYSNRDSELYRNVSEVYEKRLQEMREQLLVRNHDQPIVMAPNVDYYGISQILWR